MDKQKHKNYHEQLEKKMSTGFKSTEKSIIGFFVKNYRFTYLLLAALVAMGIFSLFTLPKEAEPEVQVPFAMITTVYPGANPGDIEDLVTNKLEKKIKNLDNLKLYRSSSGVGFSNIFVEFEAEANLTESFRKLREAVDDAKPDLPTDAETPVVNEINFNDLPIVTYSLVGNYSNAQMKNFADILKSELENINDVSKADIIGGQDREFQILVNQQKLAGFNISLGQIVGAIRSANVSLPAGDIEIDGLKYNVRVKGKFINSDQLNSTVITTYDGSPVFLNDLAIIKDTFKDKKTISRLGFANTEPKPAISIQLKKRTGGNILNIVDKANAKIEELKKNKTLPSNITIQKTNDNSVFIRDDIKTLGTSGLQTVALITIILLLILSLRGAFITALSVPFAFLIAFIFLKMQNLTLNSMVLFSLVLSLGLMVDNAIVIIEGFNEYVSKHQKTVYEAVILSIWNFKWAITAGTLTTVAAFLPMFLVSGILGQYISILPKTISVTLLSSLFVALVVIPTLISRFIKINPKTGFTQRNKKRHKIIDAFFARLYKRYKNFMSALLPNQKKRRLILIFVWLLFLVALTVPLSGLMEVQMFPQIDIDYFFVNIELPVGTTLDITSQKVKAVEKIISALPEVDNYVTNIGSQASADPNRSGSNGSHLANITVNLINKDKRKIKSYKLAENLREKLKTVSGVKIKVEELAAGPPTGSPIEIKIFGQNLAKMADLNTKVKKYLQSVAEVINIRDNLESAAGEFVFSVDKQKSDFYGLDVATIATTLRNAIFGTTAAEINVNGDDVDITVKYDKNKFTSANDLGELLLITRSGAAIPIKQVAKIKLEPSLLSIAHRNGKKVILITADLKKDADLKKVLTGFNKFQNTLILNKDESIKVGGEVEDIQKSFKELFESMILSVILIAAILILQFNSFKQPFIILFSVPLAFIGVTIGLNLLLMPFSFLVFIGLVSLSGIAVNDAIVLIDKINKNIDNGMEFFAAVVDGGVSRMQPIFLTSITTIAGIFPLLYANELWRGFSVTVIFGLAFSTVLTLFIIPIYYVSLCQKEKCQNPE